MSKRAFPFAIKRSADNEKVCHKILKIKLAYKAVSFEDRNTHSGKTSTTKSYDTK